MTEQERVLLAAVLWLATQALHSAGSAIAATAAAKTDQLVVNVGGALPSIKKQFERAFTPGALAAARANINIVG